MRIVSRKSLFFDVLNLRAKLNSTLYLWAKLNSYAHRFVKKAEKGFSHTGADDAPGCGRPFLYTQNKMVQNEKYGVLFL